MRLQFGQILSTNLQAFRRIGPPDGAQALTDIATDINNAIEQGVITGVDKIESTPKDEFGEGHPKIYLTSNGEKLVTNNDYDAQVPMHCVWEFFDGSAKYFLDPRPMLDFRIQMKPSNGYLEWEEDVDHDWQPKRFTATA